MDKILEINETELVNLAKTGDESAIKKLYDLNYKICQTVSHKYDHDITNAVWSLLWEAITTFDSSKKNKFSTWFWMRCFFYVSKEKSKLSREPINFLEENESCEDERIEAIKTELSYIPKPQVKELMMARYFGENLLTFEELSKKFNYSVQYAQILDSAGKNWLRKKLLKK